MRIAALVLLAWFVAVGARAQAPATLTIHGHNAAAGAGFSWGAGTLQFQGQSYPVRADGFILGGVGATEFDVAGTVTGLTKAEDLNGNFTAVVGGGVLGRAGGGTIVM